MKTPCTILATALAAVLRAAVPIAWTNAPGMPPYPIKPVPHGVPIDFRVTLRGYTEPPVADGADLRLWYQTNGMGAAWWSAPATLDGDVITATFGPEQDVGADRVSLFFGAPSNVFAAAVLRLTHAPGFAPGAMPDHESFRESDPVFAEWLSATTRKFDPGADVWTVSGAMDLRLGKERDGYYVGTSGGTTYALLYTWHEWTFGTAQDNATVTGEPAATNLAFEIGGATYALSRGEWVDVPIATLDDIPSADLTPATNYTNQVATEFADGVRIVFQAEVADNASRASVSDVTHSIDGDEGRMYQSDLILAMTNAAEAVTERATNALEQDIADLRTESQLVYRLYQGSNVVAEVTNYNSSVHAPELRIMQLNESNEYVTVWTETNGLARTLRDATNYAVSAIAEHAAPRAWSKVTAGMGVEAPSNTTWLSTARTVIAGGLEYEKHVTSGGSIWLLEANGMTPDFHPQTNNTAFLDLANADGTPIFRVEKTDSFLVGVHIDAVTVDGNALVCSVGVVATEHPLVRVRASLSSGEWIREEDGIPASLATVTWSGSTGNWTCRIANNTGGGQLFAQMEYLQEGGTKIVNAAPMSVSQGILCTDGIHKCRPAYSNGSITWEVVP